MKAELLYWQQWAVFAEPEECDKVLGATAPQGPKFIIKADRSIADEPPACGCTHRLLTHTAPRYAWQLFTELLTEKRTQRYQVGNSRSAERKEEERERCEGR